MATKDESLLSLQLIQEIAAKHGKTPAQVILRWGVQHGTTIIPKTSKKDPVLHVLTPVGLCK